MTALIDTLRQFFRVINALLMREMHSRYGNYRMGYVWAFIEPMIHIGVFYVIRAMLGWQTPFGIPVILYLITGFLPYFIFRNTVNGIINGANANRGLMSYQQVHLFDIWVARGVLEFFNVVAVLTIFVLLYNVGFFTELEVLLGFKPRYLINSYELNIQSMLGCLAIMGLLWGMSIGVGICFAVATSFFPTAKVLSNLVMRVLYFTSGIFYSSHAVPQQYHDILAINPLIHCIESFREMFFVEYSTFPAFQNMGYVSACLLLSVLFGLMLAKRYYFQLLRVK